MLKTILQDYRKEVLKIASLQPTSPAVLEEIARDRVKKALTCNPFCRPSLALYLLKYILARELREIARDEYLHLAVQDGAHQWLQHKA